ncbi:MAG: multicopper oxidase domain-containing protein [Nitrospirota bacterium]|nr:multicopper oxidase domain-containing protein [Nitrospirota bacterium]
MKRHFAGTLKIFLLPVSFFIISLGIPFQPLHAQDRPVKEFEITVQETAITLLEDPKKEATVWAYALKGEKPSVPGPVIRVNKGDLVKVHFTNTHSLPHTMHFHGVHPFNMDGNGQRAMGREQVQLPGESYTYEWVAADPGFYFYHCHFDTANHLDHGMYGLFVVEDPAWPKVDRVLVTIWDEWDPDADGKYDTHTINSRSAPSYVPLKANVGDRVRLILANIGFEFHTPHLHGQRWVEVNAGNPALPGWDNPNGVLSIGPAEIKVVEFTVQHVGIWLFHCHVVPHVADDGKYPRGMLTRLQVTADESMPSSQSVIEKEAKVGGGDPSHESQVASIQNSQPFDYPAGLPDRGYDVYNKNCKACHGNRAKGEYGPALQQNPILHDDTNFWKTLLKGRGNMPAWEERLSTQQIADVQAYLKTLKPPPPL